MTIPSFKRIIQRIKALWLSFVLFLLFHNELGLMPLYHNDSVKVNELNPVQQEELFLLMLGYYSIPILIYLILSWGTSTPCRFDLFCHTHFFITLLYTLSNIMHFISEILIKKRPDQIIITFFMLIIGILLNWQAWDYVTQMNLYRESQQAEREALTEEETGTPGASSLAEGTTSYGAINPDPTVPSAPLATSSETTMVRQPSPYTLPGFNFF